MLNFTAVAPGGNKPFDYAGIKRDRPDHWGEHLGKKPVQGVIVSGISVCVLRSGL
jgi:hypothetical protein